MGSATSDTWNPAVEVTAAEERLLKLCKKQKLWAFLRLHRCRILDDEVRAGLRAMYDASGRGSPVSPERLALALILQVAFHVADHEVPTLTAADRRWRMILDLDLEGDETAFSQGSVFHFRERAREHGFMQMLLDKTVRLARETKGFSHKRLRMMIDSSPLLGAGRVEDTFNLIGRAVARLVSVASEETGCAQADLVDQLELTVVSASSVKAALDIDWRLPHARSEALNTLFEQFGKLKAWLEEQFAAEALQTPPLSESLELVERLFQQDTEPDPDDPTGRERRIREGGADRQVSISDPDMRHGRKSKTKLFTGYKRHVTTDADVRGLVLGVHVLPANVHEHAAAQPLLEDAEQKAYHVTELHHDRGYLPADAIHERRANGMRIVSKPPSPPRSRERLGKADFVIDTEAETVTCPAGQTAVVKHAPTRSAAHFSRTTCADCLLKSRCLNKNGQKSIVLHPREALHQQMAAELATAEGRAKRRERVAVEHALARLGSVQGTKARFRGLQKNQFHTESCAVVANLYVLDGLLADAA